MLVYLLHEPLHKDGNDNHYNLEENNTFPEAKYYSSTELKKEIVLPAIPSSSWLVIWSKTHTQCFDDLKTLQITTVYCSNISSISLWDTAANCDGQINRTDRIAPQDLAYLRSTATACSVQTGIIILKAFLVFSRQILTTVKKITQLFWLIFGNAQR